MGKGVRKGVEAHASKVDLSALGGLLLQRAKLHGEEGGTHPKVTFCTAHGESAISLPFPHPLKALGRGPQGSTVMMGKNQPTQMDTQRENTQTWCVALS